MEGFHELRVKASVGCPYDAPYSNISTSSQDCSKIKNNLKSMAENPQFSRVIDFKNSSTENFSPHASKMDIYNQVKSVDSKESLVSILKESMRSEKL